MKSDGGEASFSVLLFQDIAVIPMLAFLPFLAMPELAGEATAQVAGHGEKPAITAVQSQPDRRPCCMAGRAGHYCRCGAGCVCRQLSDAPDFPLHRSGTVTRIVYRCCAYVRHWHCRVDVTCWFVSRTWVRFWPALFWPIANIGTNWNPTSNRSRDSCSACFS